MAAGPDGLLAHHLTEWADGSAVAPELAAANLLSISGQTVLEALAGERLAQLGGHASQYATTETARILRPLEPLDGRRRRVVVLSLPAPFVPGSG